MNNNLQKIRVWRKLTQAQLAKKTGISVSTIRLVELGKTEPGSKFKTEMARALGLPLVSIFPPKYKVGQRVYIKPSHGNKARLMIWYPQMRGFGVIEETCNLVGNYQVTNENSLWSIPEDWIHPVIEYKTGMRIKYQGIECTLKDISGAEGGFIFIFDNIRFTKGVFIPYSDLSDLEELRELDEIEFIYE
jgi:DNA-binding XRE family transcriptional regulator